MLLWGISQKRHWYEGADEYREGLRLVKEEVKELDDSLQAVKNSMEQLAQSAKEFSKLFRQE